MFLRLQRLKTIGTPASRMHMGQKNHIAFGAPS